MESLNREVLKSLMKLGPLDSKSLAVLCKGSIKPERAYRRHLVRCKASGTRKSYTLEEAVQLGEYNLVCLSLSKLAKKGYVARLEPRQRFVCSTWEITTDGLLYLNKTNRRCLRQRKLG
jgi:hypothetical protein